MSELLPCPFCGGEAETLTAESMHGGNLYGVMCANCAGRSDVYDTEAEAIAAWNSRADYHGYEQAAIDAWESIKAWNSRAERPCSMTRADRLLEELNNDRRINKQLKMANALLRKSEAAKIERIEQLESLIRDMWREMATCTDYATPPCMTRNICEQMRNLGIEVRA